MSLRITGAVLVIVGCGGFGFFVAAAYCREIRSLQQLLTALDYMQCDLQYHLTPLPELCRKVASVGAGIIRSVFTALASELEDQISPDVDRCVRSALAKHRDLPKHFCEVIELLGQSLGRFDLDGQVRGLESVRNACRERLNTLSQNQTVRQRSYQTLGLCAGAALAILFI